jgi:uncharacterized protein
MTDRPTIAVRGEAMIEVEPELAEFAVTVTSRDRDKTPALAQLAERVAAVRAVLERYADAIEKRETSRLSVWPETWDASRLQDDRVVAYRGSATTTVLVSELDTAGEMMLRVAAVEGAAVDGLRWSVRPASPVYREARQAAVAEAVTRARDYAAALGAEVTGLLALSDLPGSNGIRNLAMPASFSAAGAADAPVLDLDPQRQQVRASVEAHFTISEPTALARPLD